MIYHDGPMVIDSEEGLAALAELREIALALPEVSERPSHMTPAFFIRDKLDVDPDWDEVAEIVTEAYRLVAPKSLVKQLTAGDDQ